MERGDGASGAMAVCTTAALIGLFGRTSPEWQWLLDGIAAFALCGLIYASRAWWRAYH